MRLNPCTKMNEVPVLESSSKVPNCVVCFTPTPFCSCHFSPKFDVSMTLKNIGGPMKRLLLFSLIALAFILLVLGCGDARKNPVQMTGTMTMLQTGDAVNDQIVKFELTISSITLTGTGGTANTANLLSGPAEVEFTHEAGTFEPLSLTHVPPRTYSAAPMSVSNPHVTAII